MTSSTSTNPPQKFNLQDPPATENLPSSTGNKYMTKTKEVGLTGKFEEESGSDPSVERIKGDLIPFPSPKLFLKTFLEGLASSSKKVLGKRNMVYEDEEKKNVLVQKNFMASPLPLSQLILYPVHVHAPGEIEKEEGEDGIEDNDNQEDENQENDNNGDDGNQEDDNGEDEDDNEEDEEDENGDEEEDEEDENEVDEDEEVDEQVWYNFLMNVYERMPDDWERYQQILGYFHNLGSGLINVRELRLLVEDAIDDFEYLKEEFKSALVYYYGENYENIEDDENEEEEENDEEVDDQVWYNFYMKVLEEIPDLERYTLFLKLFHIRRLGLITRRELGMLVEDAIGSFEGLMEEFKSTLEHYYGDEAKSFLGEE